MSCCASSYRASACCFASALQYRSYCYVLPAARQSRQTRCVGRTISTAYLRRRVVCWLQHIDSHLCKQYAGQSFCKSRCQTETGYVQSATALSLSHLAELLRNHLSTSKAGRLGLRSLASQTSKVADANKLLQLGLGHVILAKQIVPLRGICSFEAGSSSAVIKALTVRDRPCISGQLSHRVTAIIMDARVAAVTSAWTTFAESVNRQVIPSPEFLHSTNQSALRFTVLHPVADVCDLKSAVDRIGEPVPGTTRSLCWRPGITDCQLFLATTAGTYKTGAPRIPAAAIVKGRVQYVTNIYITLFLQDVLQTVHIKNFWQQCAPSEGQQVAQAEHILTSSLQVMSCCIASADCTSQTAVNSC